MLHDAMPALAYASLALGLMAAAAGARGHPKWYWAAAALMYLASFLGSASIGLYLLSLTFALFALALAHALGRVQRAWHAAAAVAAGLAAWLVAVRAIDDYWLFLPFRLIF